MSTLLLDHNIPIYNEFCELIMNEKLGILVTATGTGKSYIAAEFLNNHSDIIHKTLIVVPTNSIKYNWQRLGIIETAFEVVTYAYFCKNYKYFANNNFDCYIFDEAHHVGANIWSIAFSYIKDNTDSYIIGLTANPVRYNDYLTDVSTKYFDGNVVYGYGLSEAISSRIIPKTAYVYALFDKDHVSKWIKESITQKDMDSLTPELKNKLNLNIRNIASMKDILLKHMPDGNKRKGIVFVENIEDVRTGIRIIREAFPNAPVLSVHSKMKEKDIEENNVKFKSMKYGYMVAVNMLNEGVHINGVNTAIMLRRTGSPSLYEQQIGRALSHNSENPIIFDFVGNKKSIESVKFSYRKPIIDDGYTEIRRNSKYEKKISHQYIMYDYVSPIEDILMEIEREIFNRTKNMYIRWSKEEDQFIKDNYGKIPTKDIANKLGRSINSIKNRAYSFNLNLNINTKWSEEDLQFLKDNYDKMPVKDIANKLGRSIGSIKFKISNLNLTIGKHLSEEDLQFIKDNYGKIPTKDIANKLGKNAKQICAIANRFNLTSGRNWTSKDDQFIKDNYGKIPTKDIADKLGRSVCSVMCRAGGKLNLISGRSWTSEDEQYLKDNYGKIPKKDIADKLGRSACSIRLKAGKLNLQKNNNKTWSEEDLQFLKDNYGKMPVKDIANKLGRSIDSIRIRVRKLNLPKLNKTWSEEDLQFLRDNYGKIPTKDIANKLGRSISSIHYKTGMRGLKISK